MEEQSDRVRLDRWLWSARFVKSRSLAIEAVKAGRIEVNGARVKPSREVRPGDRLEITVGHERRTVVIQATAERRGPAGVAALLYIETPESVAERERQAERRRLEPAPDAARSPRPTRRDRRRLDAARGRG